MAPALKQFPVVRYEAASRSHRVDAAATEEPLEVRVNGDSFAVIMRTPGSDEQLAAGFLLAEQLVRRLDDILAVTVCLDANGTPLCNVLDVRLAADASLAGRLAARRQITTTSACGLCGRLTIESLQVEARPIEGRWSVDPAVVLSLPDALRRAQSVFDRTGGLHAAGLFDRDGNVEIVAEDVGRHNAVDKVIGAMLLAGRLPLDDLLLFVSGRASFEIVQKAFIAGIPIVGAVSAPSSLAIDLAQEAGMTLLGFVRTHGFNAYTHPHRLVPAAGRGDDLSDSRPVSEAAGIARETPAGRDGARV